MLDDSLAEIAPNEDDDARASIAHAALLVFGRYGYARTSMADIAEAAGMSRPALYLHFKNKGEIFHAAAAALVDTAIERASDAADAISEDDLPGRLDAALQGFHGDLFQAMCDFPHGEELWTAASNTFDLTDLMRDAEQRLSEVFNRIVSRAPSGQTSDEYLRVLVLAPHGFKTGNPAPADFRRLLRALAECVAAAIDN